MEENETLGQRIRRIRNQRGMSLAKVVRDDFSRAFLNQVEMGKARPSIRVLRVIAERLGTEVEYLLEGQEAGIERELALEKGRVMVARGEPRRALLPRPPRPPKPRHRRSRPRVVGRNEDEGSSGPLHA